MTQVSLDRGPWYAFGNVFLSIVSCKIRVTLRSESYELFYRNARRLLLELAQISFIDPAVAGLGIFCHVEEMRVIRYIILDVISLHVMYYTFCACLCVLAYSKSVMKLVLQAQ